MASKLLRFKTVPSGCRENWRKEIWKTFSLFQFLLNQATHITRFQFVFLFFSMRHELKLLEKESQLSLIRTYHNIFHQNEAYLIDNPVINAYKPRPNARLHSSPTYTDYARRNPRIQPQLSWIGIDIDNGLLQSNSCVISSPAGNRYERFVGGIRASSKDSENPRARFRVSREEKCRLWSVGNREKRSGVKWEDHPSIFIIRYG